MGEDERGRNSMLFEKQVQDDEPTFWLEPGLCRRREWSLETAVMMQYCLPDVQAFSQTSVRIALCHIRDVNIVAAELV
jgi:hypothetical protein